ncbi:MAG: replication-associated recombination protein A [Tissierellia bacterium]|nr:replication-associated recombination protein A [Tissierellia bacterium]
MDLFSFNRENNLKKKAPLADRMRPESLDRYYGQGHIIGPGRYLNRLIKSGNIISLIFYGPPGTGKTTLAHIIAESTSSEFEKISAVTSGIKEIREVIKRAEDNLGVYNKSTILFIDEIHRFNKTQQDALLPHVEKGLITLIGATTENPFFSVNKALLSRCQVLELKPLSSDDIEQIIKLAIKEDSILQNLNIEIEDEAIEYLKRISNGDARVALNSLEIASITSDIKDGITRITDEDIRDSVQKKAVRYDRDGDEHYNIASAFIKSIRGSDVDASLYYLALMIESGEDPRFIARRIVISAAEDIGLADPNALSIAVAAHSAVEKIGMPEGRIPLAEATVYLALAPKSNSAYTAIDKAIEFVKNSEHLPIPIHLRDTHYQGSKEFGHGEGYKYPHSYENGYIEQDYLPEKIKDMKFYKRKNIGREKDLNNYDDLKKK